MSIGFLVHYYNATPSPTHSLTHSLTVSHTHAHAHTHSLSLSLTHAKTESTRAIIHIILEAQHRITLDFPFELLSMFGFVYLGQFDLH